MSRGKGYRNQREQGNAEKREKFIRESAAAIVAAVNNQTFELQNARHSKEKEDSDGLSTLKRQVNAALWLNIITLFSAAVGLGGLVILYFTLNESRNATIAANRAWVVPQNMQLRWLSDIKKSAEFDISLGNTGKQPAIDASIYINESHLSSSQLASASIERISMKECMTYHQSAGPVAIFPSSYPDGPFTKATIDDLGINDDIRSGRKILLLRGCVIYTTMNNPHYTTFCAYFGRPPSGDGVTHLCESEENAN